MDMVTDEGLDPAILPQYVDLGDGSEAPEQEGDGEVARMDDADILKIICEEVENASEMQSERQDNQTEAVDYFYARLPSMTEDEADASMANIVSTDVADAVEAVLSEIIPAFSGTSPVEFVPLTAQDEDQADLETRAVNHVANSSGAFMALNMAGKDALLRRAGVIKVFWEERVKVEYQPLNHTMDQMPQVLQEAPNERVEIAQADMDESGMVTGFVRRYTKTSKPRIVAVPRDEFLISSDAVAPDADEARFVAHQSVLSRSDLIELGFDEELVKGLEPFESTQSSARYARIRDVSETTMGSPDEATDLIMVVESYTRIDIDRDGIAELRRIWTAGGAEGVDVLLSEEPWSEQPFCIGVPYLGIYSWDGVSLFDKLKMVQDTKTWLLRDLLNASRRNVRQRMGAVEREVNIDDLRTSVMGGVVRCKQQGSVFPLPNVEVPPQLFNVLAYMDEVRRDKGGGAIDTAAQANILAGDTAHGLERMMSAAEQVNAMVAKNLAETMVKPMYLKLHSLMRSHQRNPVVVAGSVGWQEANPATWTPRDSMVVSLGMSVGERTRRSAALSGILQAQMTAMQAGQDGTLVTPQNLYQTVIDAARMAGLPSPEQYWTNPASPQGQQAAQQKAQAAQQQAQQAQAVTQAQLQVPVTMEQVKSQAAVQVAQIRSQSDQAIQAMKSQMDAMQKTVENAMAMLDKKLKLVEMGAKYDGDSVPDTLDAVKLNEVQEPNEVEEPGEDEGAEEEGKEE